MAFHHSRVTFQIVAPYSPTKALGNALLVVSYKQYTSIVYTMVW